MTTPGKEELEAVWERLRELGKSVQELDRDIDAKTLGIARESAFFLVTTSYNLALTTLGVGDPDKLPHFIKYVGPKLEEVGESIYKADNIGRAFEIASKFQSDCIRYLKSLK